ncbi:MAG TPA: phosphatase PAP2 family protein [Candidatus Saccharimonadales bacterium]|nr:phosphatase PAP2 family protein [Candidatus Saccharimonadales bacterium]
MPTDPKPLDDKNKTGLWIAFFVGLALLIASMIVAAGNALGGWQASIFHAINNESGSLTNFAKFITEALGAAYPIAICVIVPLLFKKYRLAWRFFFTAGGAIVAGFAVKYLVNEPRPEAILHHHDIHVRAIETGPGFPSGHMLAATSLALTLWFILPKAWRWVSVLWILLVAWSRLYLGVHTPADIISGFSIGLMAVCFVRLLPPSIAKPLRLDEPVASPAPQKKPVHTQNA